MASTDLVIIKLKPKKEFRGHVIFEPMRPNYLDRFLRFLKEKNYLYSDIEISLHNISDTLLNFKQDSCEERNPFKKMLEDAAQEMHVVVENQDNKQVE